MSVVDEGYRLRLSHITEPEVDASTDDAIQQFVAESFAHFDAFDVDEETDVVITIQEEAVMHQDMLCEAIRYITQEQMKRWKVNEGITVGFHHEVLNPLFSSLKYPQK
jgi:hypothetical protein